MDSFSCGAGARPASQMGGGISSLEASLAIQTAPSVNTTETENKRIASLSEALRKLPEMKVLFLPRAHGQDMFSRFGLLRLIEYGDKRSLDFKGTVNMAVSMMKRRAVVGMDDCRNKMINDDVCYDDVCPKALGTHLLSVNHTQRFEAHEYSLTAYIDGFKSLSKTNRQATSAQKMGYDFRVLSEFMACLIMINAHRGGLASFSRTWIFEIASLSTRQMKFANAVLKSYGTRPFRPGSRLDTTYMVFNTSASSSQHFFASWIMSYANKKKRRVITFKSYTEFSDSDMAGLLRSAGTLLPGALDGAVPFSTHMTDESKALSQTPLSQMFVVNNNDTDSLPFAPPVLNPFRGTGSDAYDADFVDIDEIVELLGGTDTDTFMTDIKT